MRLVKVSAPLGSGSKVADAAFSAGINQVTVQQVETRYSDGKIEAKDIVNIQTSTPKAKRFVDALLQSDFYNRDEFTINTRQPRSIISSESLYELTKPLVEPAPDVFEDLWQFSHITVGFIGRIFLGGCLLAYGLIHQQILTIIAALLFLPLLPTLLAVSFGAWTKQWKLVGQGALAFLTAIFLLVLSGVLVALFSEPPLKFNEFSSLPASFLISVAVGVAAGLATPDDVGRRELIGLAATSQIAIIPVWFAICFVFGFPQTISKTEIISHAIDFFMNFLTIFGAALVTYVLLGAASTALENLETKKS